MPPVQPRVAYFSMEIALESSLPTYSGGLGVLAGDTLRSCADLGLAMCAVTLVHRQGYFQQGIAPDGEQRERPDPWRPEDRLEALPPRVAVEVGGKSVRLRAWRYRVASERGTQIPVYLLDADLPENAAEHRRLTDRLYGGDDAYRLGQEIVLGIGGVRMLRALGHGVVERFHLNEGHAALAIPELIEALGPAGGDREVAIEQVRSRCIFTTHTPVPAGHDRFPAALWKPLMGERIAARLAELGVEDELNMTQVALDGARFVNGVAMRHGEVSRSMFPGYPIRSITNGVHLTTWAAPSFRALFDRHIPHWRSDAFSLRHATAISLDEIAAAHAEAKRRLLETVRDRVGRALDPNALTLGFGRRATAYKRATLVLRDLARLRRICAATGPLQLVFGGKAHPNDAEGRQIIHEIHRLAHKAGDDLPIVFLPGYDMDVCARLVAGCDVWLNTPIPPLEASGTSGMKAAVNGVPSLSMLDGWWVEGCVENVTGWAIGGDREGNELSAVERDRLHATQLYEKLESAVVPCFFREPEQFLRIMRQTIAINASHFNTQRMVQEYLFEAYQSNGGESGDPIWVI